MDLLHHLGKGKEELSPLQYHFKSLHIISRHYKKSLLRSQIYHGYEELSTDILPYMKKTKITLYEEDKKEEASMRCSLLHGSWDQILRRRPSVCPSVRPERFPGICRRMHGGISLKFYMLMYLDHLQNWSVYGHGLLIFLILALFWLSEMGQIWGFRAFPGERMEGMAWNFARWCILTTFRTD